METLVMPINYVELQEDEMMYLDGGWAIPNWVVTGAIAGATTATLAALGGWGLQAVLFSYGMKTALVGAIVKGLGIIGIHVGNFFVNNIVNGISMAGVGAFADSFARSLDRNDGNEDGWINW